MATNQTNFFEFAFRGGPLKTGTISVTVVLVLFLAAAGYGIIWFEKFGSDKKRTLINRVFTSIVWTGMQYYLFVLPVDIFRYIFGPLPNVLCFAHIVSKNLINFQTVLFCDGVTTARYIFVFHLKNPARFHDDFWHLFLNIWIIGSGIISQFVFVYLPGQQPINYYICTGVDPKAIISDPEEAAVKKNHVFSILLLLSTFLQLGIACKFIIHRMKMDSETTYTYIDSFWKENLFDFIISFCFLSIAITFGYLVIAIQTVPPDTLNEFPNYLLMYGLNFWFPIGACLLFVILFYGKNKQMRETLWAELKGQFFEREQ